jgi:CubicO group peptidase (beta-lactamase class C family)
MWTKRSTPPPLVAGSRLSCLCAVLLLIALPGKEVSQAGQDVPTLLGAVRPAAHIDRALEAAFERTGVATASIAVVGPAGSLYSRTLGRRFGDPVAPADTRTVFRAASLGKAVFAYLVFTLVGSGQLDLDRPLHEYLPKPLTDYPDYTDLRGDLRYRTITARLALSHRTGFPNWRWQLDDGKLRILFDPGTKFLYSGEGYRYLQLVVEQIAGRTLEALAQERVFRPLGMNDTSYAWTDRFAANCAIDRAPIEKVFGRDFLRQANCAGSLLTTATDYARFLGAILDGKGLPGRLRDEMLRPQASIAGPALFGPPADTGPAAAAGAAPSWCLGWGAFASRAGAARFHVGYDSPEYDNYAALYLDRKIGLVVLTSGGRGPNSAVPHLVEAAIGNNDTPFVWAGYGEPARRPRPERGLPGASRGRTLGGGRLSR